MDFSAYLTSPWIWAIVVLMIFAIVDLIVGVTNDAVNFLNSSFWSKVASKKTILWIAAGGIFVGALLSGGMMEIARKGIFNPALFTFYDIIIVFFSVVMASAIILDIYNSLKLPTSTTVLIVFELLWAGLAIALIHLFQDDLTISRVSEFINGSGTISIISGIFLSVWIAFVAWWVVQIVVRWLVTFDYKKTLVRRWWLFGAISMSVILYFLVVKWLQQAEWFPQDIMSWMMDNTRKTLGLLFVGSWLLSVILQRIFHIDILKVIVLLWTFALAAAFASNDLVNFIGVPIAWLQSIMIYLAAGASNPLMTMETLASSVDTSKIYLLVAALIMIITLLTSKKIQSISSTELWLTKHATGQEQFKPGRISRWIVKKTLTVHRQVIILMPTSWQKTLARRFIHASPVWWEATKASYDLVRASVNLTLSAVLIAMATNLLLPLSTTYITFMVAMGTALADGAWGRDSAVYRISWVLTVIWSWLMTAVIALVLTLCLTLLLRYFWFWAVGVIMLGIAYMLYHSYKKKPTSTADDIVDALRDDGDLSDILLFQSDIIVQWYISVLSNVMNGLIQDDDKLLEDWYTLAKTLAYKTKYIKTHIHRIFANSSEEIVDGWHTYVQGVEVLRKATLALFSLAEQAQDYVLNRHPDLIEQQHEELRILLEHLTWRCEYTQQSLHWGVINSLRSYDNLTEQLVEFTDETKRSQFARIKYGETGIRNTNLYINILTEIDTLVLSVQKLLHYARRIQEGR